MGRVKRSSSISCRPVGRALFVATLPFLIGAAEPERSAPFDPAALSHIRGLERLPATMFRDNLAMAVRINRAASPARRTRAVVEATSRIGYSALGPRAGAILEAMRRDATGEAGDVLAAIERIGGKRVGADAQWAKADHARRNAYGIAYAAAPKAALPGNPRPWLVSAAIRLDPRYPGSILIDSPAYPSGHTTDAFTQSLLLAAIFPERYRSILIRGADYGQSRIVLGVHYPLDVIAGRVLATASVANLLNADLPVFGIARPRRFTAAATAVRAELARRCRMSVAACVGPDHAPVSARRSYRQRLTYGLSLPSGSEMPPAVPAGAEVLLATVFPRHSKEERRAMLARTALSVSVPLDEQSGYARLDLVAATRAEPSAKTIHTSP